MRIMEIKVIIKLNNKEYTKSYFAGEGEYHPFEIGMFASQAAREAWEEKLYDDRN